MKQDVKTRWLEALRSGKYRRGSGVLRTNDDRFCCLGVLCDVVDPAKWEHHGGHRNEYSYDDQSTAYLPHRLRDELGIDSSEETDLACMNDQGASFSEIANHIEVNL